MDPSEWSSGGRNLGAAVPGLVWDQDADGPGSGAWRFWNSGHNLSWPHWWERHYPIPDASLSKWVVRLQLAGEWRAFGDVNAEQYGATLRLIVDRQQSPTELDTIGVAAFPGEAPNGYIHWPSADTGGWQSFQTESNVTKASSFTATMIRLRLQGKYPAGGSQVWYVRRVNVRVVFSDGTEFNTFPLRVPGLAVPAAPSVQQPLTGYPQRSSVHLMTLLERSLSTFQPVIKTDMAPSFSPRNPSGAKVQPSGLVKCNKELSDAIIEASQKKFKNLVKAGLKWFVNPTTKEVAGRMVDLDSLGATPIRQMKGGTFNLYMHNVLTEYPTLRLIGVRSVPVTMHKDAEGHFFIFHLNMAVVPSRNPRRPAATAAPANAACALDEVPKA